MTGDNSELHRLDQMGRDLADEARRTNAHMNGTGFRGTDFSGQSLGRDSLNRVPPSILALGVAVLAGGIAGHVLADTVGMWVGMVVGGGGAFGAIAWVESRRR